MFPYENPMVAVQAYVANGYNLGAVIRELGYPSPGALRQWYKECMETGELKKRMRPKTGGADKIFTYHSPFRNISAYARLKFEVRWCHLVPVQ